MPRWLVAAAHITITEADAIKARSRMVAPSERTLRILIAFVGLVNEPNVPDFDERAHAKDTVKGSQSAVPTAINKLILD
jgi:hypothetical protein